MLTNVGLCELNSPPIGSFEIFENHVLGHFTNVSVGSWVLVMIFQKTCDSGNVWSGADDAKQVEASNDGLVAIY